MFQPRQFKRLGEVIERNPNNKLLELFAKNQDLKEARYRTAIGRYYYYIFLELRESILRKIPFDSEYRDLLLPLKKSSNITFKPNVHSLVGYTIYYLGFMEYKYFFRLRNYRNGSDYEIKMEDLNNIISDSRNCLNELEKVVKKLSTKSPIEIEEALRKAVEKLRKIASYGKTNTDTT